MKKDITVKEPKLLNEKSPVFTGLAKWEKSFGTGVTT